MEKIPYKEFKVNITQTLSKDVGITTNNYSLKRVFNESLNRNVLVPDTSNTDWKELFVQEHWDIEALLKELKEYILLDMKKGITNKSISRLTSLLSMCDGWKNISSNIVKANNI